VTFTPEQKGPLRVDSGLPKEGQTDSGYDIVNSSVNEFFEKFSKATGRNAHEGEMEEKHRAQKMEKSEPEKEQKVDTLQTVDSELVYVLKQRSFRKQGGKN
jgi:hypothetical protein